MSCSVRIISLVLVLESWFMVGCGGSSPSPSSAKAIIGENTMTAVAQDLSNLPAEVKPLIDAVGMSNDKCTVFHLGSGLAATAGHCFWTPGASGDDKPCQTLSVSWGAVGGREPTLRSRCMKLVGLSKGPRADFAFFIVDPVPKVSIPVISEKDSSEHVAVLGYPNNEPLKWSEGCRVNVMIQDPVRFEHDCDTLPGHSGSPVLSLGSKVGVVGIHSGGDSVNYGTLLSQTPYRALLEAARNSADQREVPGSLSSLKFGPFGPNEFKLLAAIPSSLGHHVSMHLGVDTEESYDKVTIADGSGRIQEYSGKQVVRLSRLKTPVTVVFQSDYAGPSNQVTISATTVDND